MKKFIALTGFMVFLCFVLHINSHAQAYIKYSHQDSVSSYSNMVNVVNGEVYVLKIVGAFGDGGATLKKYAVDGSLLYSRDISLESPLSIRATQVINGEVYLSARKPDNIGCCGIAIQAIKVLADGSIAYNRDI